MGAYLWIFQRPTKSGKLNYDFHKVCEGINASKLIKLRVKVEHRADSERETLNGSLREIYEHVREIKGLWIASRRHFDRE
jgi:hypothetical protein